MYVSGVSNAGTREGGSRLTRTTIRLINSGQRDFERNEPMVHGGPTANTSIADTFGMNFNILKSTYACVK